MAPTNSSQKPIPAYLLPFLDYCEIEKGLSNNTQKNYRQYLILFMNWLKKTGNTTLLPRELTGKHVWDYRLYLARTYISPRGKNLSKKSQNYYLIALRSLLAYFADRDIDSLPSSKVKLAKQKDDQAISFLDVHDIVQMLKVPDTTTTPGLRNRAIMELFFSSGMRVSELAALNRDNVSFLRNKAPGKTFELSIVGKGKHVRTIFISPRAATWLRAYLAARDDDYTPLFVNQHTRVADSKRLTTRSIQLIIHKCAIASGLSKKVTPHTLRHTYATDLLSHGADLRSVQELLGHKNVSTTQIYTHVTNKQLRDIHERFHGGKDIETK